MMHWLLRILSLLWYGMFFGVVLPVTMVLIGLSLDELLVSYTGIRLLASLTLDLAGLLLLFSGLMLLGLSALALHRKGKGFPWSFGSHAAFNPQVLVTVGPYSQMRHPMATGYLVMLWGVACLVPSLMMMVWLLPLSAGLMYEYFEFTEEKRLRYWFGREYEKYHQSTPSLLPRWSTVWRELRQA